jgi:ergothioneine biosynthesis protein EgtB
MHGARLTGRGAAAATRRAPGHGPGGARAADEARDGSSAMLAAALRESRADTLATFAAFERALPALMVPQDEALNPPLWELGHIGWFQEYWIARNPQRARGHQADPMVARPPSRRAGGDSLYDSGRVPHASRWRLALPPADATRHDLAAQLADTLQRLDDVDDGAADRDDALYFFRLALLHEDMHHEAALYMAQSLGIAIADPRWQVPRLPEPAAPIESPAGPWSLGSAPATGFAFDNELAGHEVAVPAASIDAQVLRWAEYLPFIETGGYADARWWDAAGRRWQRETGACMPRYLRRATAGVDGPGRAPAAWQQWRHGSWRPLDPAEPACHLSWHEAQAWCRWAGRRLPTEAEWERAALTHRDAFRWGDVWEWTASPFIPYPGFVAHPYRDYSAPWFDGRPVLRGASFMTQPRMRHARYRNYFQPHRADIAAGFRTCAA